MFTAVTVLTLALGIGANSAIFSLVNAVLLRPLGYQQPERLMMVHEIIPDSGVPRFGVSPADYLDLDQYQTAFTDIGAYRTRAMELSGTGSPESVTIAETTAAVFPLLGVNAVEGRTFLATEDQSDPSVAIISDALRRRRFAASSPIGERILLDRRPYTIVGVMPAGFEFPKRGPQFNGTPADIYLPLVFNPFERRARAMFYNHSVIGRLRDGVTIEQATRDTAALAPRIGENYPAELRNVGMALQIAATRLVDEIVGRGAAAAAHPARRGGARPAGRVRQRGQPVSQPRGGAPARARSARRSRCVAQPAVPDAAGGKPAAGIDQRCRRPVDRELDRAGCPGGADRQPAWPVSRHA